MAGGAWVDYRRMQKLSRTVGKVPVQHFYQRGYGERKTTFLNALSQAIPPEERIVTIEDSAELQLKYAQNLVSLETRNANMEGCRTISVRDLSQQFKNAAGSDYRRGSSRCRDLRAADRLQFRARREYVDRARKYGAGHAASDGDHAPDGNGHSIVCHTKTDRIGN